MDVKNIVNDSNLPNKYLINTFNNKSSKINNEKKIQLRNGFNVYNKACSSCHYLNLDFYSLTFKNGPEYNFNETENLMNRYKISDINDEGEIYLRNANFNDRIPFPYSNKIKAKYENKGYYPTDLNLFAREKDKEHIKNILNTPNQSENSELNYNYGSNCGKFKNVEALGDKPTLINDVSEFIHWASNIFLLNEDALNFSKMSDFFFNLLPNKAKDNRKILFENLKKK